MALQQNNYQQTLDNLPFGHAYHRIIYNENGKPVDFEFLEVNRAFEQIVGMAREQILHKTATQLFPEIKHLPFDWIGTYASVASTGKPADFEQFFAPLNRWFRIFASSTEKGYFTAVFADITTEMAYKHKLQESETKFSIAFRKAPFSMALTDVETGLIEEVNDAFVKFLGFEKDELIGKRTVELGLWNNPEDRDEVVNTLKAGKPVVNKEIQIRNKDGELRHGLFSASTILINNKAFILSTNEDITERKQAYAALEENELKFSKAFHLSPHTSTITDTESSAIIDVNKAFEKHSGYTREEAIGNTIIGLNVWANLDDREEMMNDLKNGQEVISREYHFRKKDGTPLIGAFSASFITIGNRQHIISSIEDITARKKAEQALRESEEKFSRAFQLAPFSITLTDGTTEAIVEVNEAFVKSTGYSREEVLGKSSASLQLWLSEAERQQVISDLRQGLPVTGREYRFRNKDGSVVYGSFSATVIFIQNKPYVLGSIEDITAKKQISESLERELAFRKYLFENAKDGYMLLNQQHQLIDANKQFCQMLGYSMDEVKGLHVWDFEAGMKQDDIVSLYSPSDMIAEIFETTFKNKEGGTFHVEVNAWSFDWRGEKIIFCACRDISARKYLENRMLKDN